MTVTTKSKCPDCRRNTVAQEGAMLHCLNCDWARSVTGEDLATRAEYEAANPQFNAGIGSFGGATR